MSQELKYTQRGTGRLKRYTGALSSGANSPTPRVEEPCDTACASYIGHSCGHLMPGNEHEAAAWFEGYLRARLWRTF